jgi:DNA-binding XRE family transcriptional regulator
MLRAEKKETFLDRVLDAAHEKLGAKVTQAQVAALIGVSQPSVYEWRTGAPKIKNGTRIAQKLGVCTEWLYSGNGPRHPWDKIAVEDDRLHEFLALWHALDAPDQKAMLGIAKHLKAENERTEHSSRSQFKEPQNHQGRPHAERPSKTPGVDKSRRHRAA